MDKIPAHVKAHATRRWAETIFRSSCRSAEPVRENGGESWTWLRSERTVSSALLKRGDLFDIVLIQIKGGSARGPTAIDCRRLLEVKRVYRAKSVVQFQWRNVDFCKMWSDRAPAAVGARLDGE